MGAFLFSLYSILSGAQQGISTWLLRGYVPAARKNWVHAALHYGGALIYLVLVGAVARPLGPLSHWAGVLLAAGLARALLFDPSLNLAQSRFNHREGRPAEPLFKVGTVALNDRTLQWVALRVGWPADRVRGLLWLVTVVGAISVYLSQLGD